jgi:cyclopropane fatty-acyl-phospholipid synthase-like methyltransferase
MDLFERQWQTYRSVVDHDWMEHRGITAACAQAFGSWMAEHPDRIGQARLLDLGCGDLAGMGPVFSALPLAGYVGVDLTEQVLPMAREALGEVGFPAQFVHDDVAQYVRAPGDVFDLVHAALVLHHLPDEAKTGFLADLRTRVRAGGCFVWADVFREPGESREAYAQRYADRIRAGWTGIDHDARETLVTHMSTYDFPADRAAIVETAEKTGWQWRWLWQGRHSAEAVALLTPA